MVYFDKLSSQTNKWIVTEAVIVTNVLGRQTQFWVIEWLQEGTTLNKLTGEFRSVTKSKIKIQR